MGLDLSKGTVRNNLEAGVIEPAMSKVKILQVKKIAKHLNIYDKIWFQTLKRVQLKCAVFQFATEAAITILRIDDMIRLVKDETQNEED